MVKVTMVFKRQNLVDLLAGEIGTRFIQHGLKVGAATFGKQEQRCVKNDWIDRVHQAASKIVTGRPVCASSK